MSALPANPFALLIDSEAVLAACAKSDRLAALPIQAHHRADRPSNKVSREVAQFDAAIDGAAPARSGTASAPRSRPKAATVAEPAPEPEPAPAPLRRAPPAVTPARGSLWAAQASWMLLPLGLLGLYAPTRSDEKPAPRP